MEVLTPLKENSIQTDLTKLTSKKELLINKLLEFYSNPKYLDIFIKIVDQGTMISLRLFDWFSTNYSKYNRIYINNIDIHSDYKDQLKGYKKEFFDPFCRRQRIFIMANNCKIREPNEVDKVNLSYKYIDNHEKYLSDQDGIVTTVGQLNFFKWCIKKNIINYILKNLTSIEKSMLDVSSYKKGKKDTVVKPKGNVYKTIMHVTVKFN